MVTKRVEFACQGLSIVFVEEDDFYSVYVSRELNELCLVSQILRENALTPACVKVDKISFERRFQNPEAFVDWLAGTCPAWRYIVSLSEVKERLRSAGWITALSEGGLEVLKLIEKFVLEVRLHPTSAAFSKVSIDVKTYPSNLEDALSLGEALVSEGFSVKALLPAVVASLREIVLFNCSIPNVLADLENTVRKVGERVSFFKSPQK